MVFKHITGLRPAVSDAFHGAVRYFRGNDPIVNVGLVLVGLFSVIVLLAGFYPVGSGQSESLGKWQAVMSSADAGRAILAEYDPKSGSLRLRPDPTEFGDLLKASDKRAFVNSHIRKFNDRVKNRVFRAPGPVKGPPDCLFAVDLFRGNDGQIHPRLVLKDLSVYNLHPLGSRERKQLGAIRLVERGQPQPFFSDGNLGFFLQPLEQGNPLRLSLTRSGIFSASVVTLTDTKDIPRATVKSGPDGTSVIVEPLGEYGVFLDNNPPVMGAQVTLSDGEIAEIGGRFFEAQLTDSTVVASTRHKGNRSKRIYPLSDLFHLVGPVSLSGEHQSLGIEYMFQEYLMGVPERDIPQGEIWLTVDRGLQTLLTNGLKDLVKFSRRGHASAAIMDAHSGALLALAAEPNVYKPENKGEILDILERGEEAFYNHGCFKRHVIGSTTKPFFAFLALQMMGDRVQELEMETNKGAIRRLFGHELFGNRDASLEIKNFKPDFYDYLIKSDNFFQHSLGLLLLSGVEDVGQTVDALWRRNGKGALVLDPTTEKDGVYLTAGDMGKRRDWLRLSGTNPFAVTLERLFDIETASGRGVVNDRDISIYGKAFLDHAGAIMQMRNANVDDPLAILKARSVICAPETPRMELQEVKNTKDASNVLFGANRNRWTDVKLCEAFSRMMTGKRVRARLVQSYRNTLDGSLVDLEAQALQDTPALEVPNPRSFAIMRRILARVPKKAEGRHPEGTAYLLHPWLRTMEREVPGFTLIGKTGTIDDGKQGDPDSRLFLGTFGIGGEDGFSGPAFTFVIYLKTALEKDAHLQFIQDQLPRWWQTLNRPPGETIEPEQKPDQKTP